MAPIYSVEKYRDIKAYQWPTPLSVVNRLGLDKMAVYSHLRALGYIDPQKWKLTTSGLECGLFGSYRGCIMLDPERVAEFEQLISAAKPIAERVKTPVAKPIAEKVKTPANPYKAEANALGLAWNTELKNATQQIESIYDLSIAQAVRKAMSKEQEVLVDYMFTLPMCEFEDYHCKIASLIKARGIKFLGISRYDLYTSLQRLKFGKWFGKVPYITFKYDKRSEPAILAILSELKALKLITSEVE